MKLLWILPLAAVASAVLTGGVLRYVSAHNILDIPNDRSSHTAPTPRGGGVAIAVTFLAGLLLLTALGQVDFAFAVALLGGGITVAVVGFIDDHRSIPAAGRLLTHFFAVIWALIWLKGLPPLLFWGNPMAVGWLGNMIAVVFLAWLLNLYNFMDGIDGIAGSEAVTVGLSAAALYLLHPALGNEWLLPALLAMVTLGFLVWNFPPARIFMGDVGSGFLGLTLGVLSIRAAWLGSEFLWSWMILLGVFVVDATATLMRRLQRREKLSEAHHNHAYQYATRRLGAHRPVTLAVAAINLFWLLPIAFLVSDHLLNGVVGLLIAYIPLLALALHFKAGARELQEL